MSASISQISKAADRGAGNFQSVVIFSQMTRECTPFISVRKLKLSTESESNSDLCRKPHHITLHNYLVDVTLRSLVVCFAVAMAADVAEIWFSNSVGICVFWNSPTRCNLLAHLNHHISQRKGFRIPWKCNWGEATPKSPCSFWPLGNCMQHFPTLWNQPSVMSHTVKLPRWASSQVFQTLPCSLPSLLRAQHCLRSKLKPWHFCDKCAVFWWCEEIFLW